MKKVLYFIFALFFNICRVFPVKKRLAVFLAPHRGGAHDSLSEFEKYVISRGEYKTVRVSSSPDSVKEAVSFFLRAPYILARAGYVFLNDNFMPLSSLRFSPETVIVQFWHGEGAFKKFGLLTNLPEDIRNREIKSGRKLSYVICTSENVRETYAKAFGVDESKVLPLGSPRLDYLLNNSDKENALESVFNMYPAVRGKKLVLYAPTFRDNPEDDREILSHIDARAFEEALGDEYALLVKLHPQVHSAVSGGINDVTDCDIGALSLACDILVTDYSSVCMDFAVLDKPCIFYAYDLPKYENERSFCFGYKDYVPGEVVTDFDGVIKAIKNPRNTGKIGRFREFNFDYIDAHNSERIYEFISDNRK